MRAKPGRLREGATLTAGQEWIIDAHGCGPDRLRSPAVLASLFEALVVQLELKVVGTPQWNVFPAPGGITGLALLSESHLAVHTFPETGFAALNVYCCRPREEPDFGGLLARTLGASSTQVRRLSRGEESSR